MRALVRAGRAVRRHGAEDQPAAQPVDAEPAAEHLSFLAGAADRALFAPGLVHAGAAAAVGAALAAAGEGDSRGRWGRGRAHRPRARSGVARRGGATAIGARLAAQSSMTATT